MVPHRNVIVGRSCSFFSMFLIIIPILVPFWSSLGLTLSEILQIQAVFGVALAIFEIPTGYVADLWGRKISICIGSFITGCGFTMIPFCSTYESIVAYEVIIALGGSLISGADIAIVYDSIKNDPNRLRYIGSLNTWSLVGEAIAGIMASMLIVWSFTPVLWAQVVVGWIPFFVSLFYLEPARERMENTRHSSNLQNVIRHILFTDTLTRRLFVNSLIWSLSSFCVVWLLQPYWQQEGVPLNYFGILWSALMFVAAGASKATHLIERRYGAPTVLISLAMAACLGYFTMAFTSGWVGVLAGAFFYINRGFAAVIFTDAFNWKIPSAFRATANSMRSFAFRLSYGFIGPATGLVVTNHGLSTTLALFGFITIGCFFVFMVPLSRQIHELHVEYIPEGQA